MFFRGEARPRALPIDFGATARRVAPTARRGAGRPAAISFGFLERAFDLEAAFDFAVAFELAFDFVVVLALVRLADAVAFALTFGRAVAVIFADTLTPLAGVRVDLAAWLRFDAPELLRVAPAFRVARSAIDAVRRTAAASRSAIRLAVAPPGTPARFAARSVLRPLRLNRVLVCAAARLALVRAAEPTRAAADVAAPAVDESVPAARPSTDPTTSAPRSTIDIVVSAACVSGSSGRVVLLSAIRKPPNGRVLQVVYQTRRTG